MLIHESSNEIKHHKPGTRVAVRHRRYSTIYELGCGSRAVVWQAQRSFECPIRARVGGRTSCHTNTNQAGMEIVRPDFFPTTPILNLAVAG